MHEKLIEEGDTSLEITEKKVLLVLNLFLFFHGSTGL